MAMCRSFACPGVSTTKNRLTSFFSEGSFSERYFAEAQIDAGRSHSMESGLWEVCVATP